MAFHFEKPSGFNFKAGQSADVTLTNPPDTDAEGNTRTFSVASPPFENELVFTTRMRDTTFKLAEESATGHGSEDRLGRRLLHPTQESGKASRVPRRRDRNHPFLSIVRQADHDRLPHKLYLFYSNRRPEDAAFLDTLQTLETTNPNFRLICTMTEMSKSKREWKGETVLIEKQMLSRHLAVLQGPIYYIAGPPTMVAAMRQTLVGAGVEEDDIRAEEFAGY
jgi:ferredoxin-NADP reductase